MDNKDVKTSSRVKKILLMISITVLIGIVCAGLFFINAQSIGSSSSQKENEPITKTLGDFRSIDGTDFLIASVTGGNYDANILSELFSSGRWYGSSYGYNQYNLVYLDIKTEAVYPLLATNEFEIVSMEGFPKPVVSFNNQSIPQQPTIPIAWWLFSIAKSDTNLDEELSSLDKKTLSVADVGGRGYTEIIPDVDDLLGTAFKNNDTLLIIYRSNGVNYLAHVDLPSRQVVRTEELPLGEEIK
ncbi:MAG TPA: hypothetical protein VJ972_04050 [Anaerolineales bacterium]|nr:hypothetical protein [Anaerolineales bacterium]